MMESCAKSKNRTSYLAGRQGRQVKACRSHTGEAGCKEETGGKAKPRRESVQICTSTATANATTTAKVLTMAS